jgi:hypothetical protein
MEKEAMRIEIIDIIADADAAIAASEWEVVS